MTAEPFDIRAAIERAAGMEWECKVPTYWNVPDAHGSCCGGTGRIVPFAALRVECPYDRETKVAHAMAGALAETEEEHNEKPYCCEGRNWVPEPDPLRACWLIASSTNWRYFELYRDGGNDGAYTWHCRVVDLEDRQAEANEQPSAEYAFWRAVEEWEKAQEAAGAWLS